MYCLLYAVAPLSKSTIPQYGHGAVHFHIYSNLDSDVLIILQSIHVGFTLKSLSERHLLSERQVRRPWGCPLARKGKGALWL